MVPLERSWSSTGITVVAFAIVLNFPWEIAQSTLYARQPPFPARIWHCFVAAIGDGVLVLVIWAIGRVALRSWEWFRHPARRPNTVMLLAGAGLGVLVETAALSMGRWSYAASMPRVGSVGLVPLLQLLVLPPLVFAVVTRFHGSWR